MKPKFNTYLKGIFITSIAALFPNKNEGIVYDLNKLDNDYKTTQLDENNKDLSSKLIIRFNDDDTYNIDSHRSHRSHSSHRSHYSSTTGTKNTPERGNNNLTLPSSTNKSATTAFTLGDRTLKEGMQGSDVTELVNLLIKKGYIELKDGSTKVDGIYTYEGVIIDAIKQFQKDNNLPVDGEVSKTLVYLLKQ